MTTAFDFSPWRRSTVGFDRLFDVLETASRAGAGDAGYPPYDIENTAEDKFRITLAVAGFKDEEIDITAQQNLLIVSGNKAEVAQEGETPRYIHRGIAARSFERRFQLADHVMVSGASLAHGLLTVDLVREVPEAMKPRKIALGSTASTSMIGSANDMAIEHSKAA